MNFLLLSRNMFTDYNIIIILYNIINTKYTKTDNKENQTTRESV